MQKKNFSELSIFIHEAIIATAVEEDGEYYLILGKGDHKCDRWKLSKSLTNKLAFELIKLALKK